MRSPICSHPAGLAVVLAAAAVPTLACKVADPPPITATWSDTFERGDIGGNYRDTSDVFAIVNGALNARGAYNHPLWLRKRLPRDVVIELDVWAKSSDGDLKIEVFGDGESYAHDQGAYRATAYVLCMGGWNNSQSFIAREDEHGRDRKTRQQPRVEIDRRYHWKVVRQGQKLDWFVDDMTTPFLSYDDPTPLAGGGHEYMGFNNWKSDAWFDNLTITPL
jgi:hypothetical protein